MRAVLDTNVVISGMLSPQGPPGRVVGAAIDGDFEVASSVELRAQLDRVLLYRRIARRLTPDDLVRVLGQLRQSEIVFEPSIRLHVLADDSDNRLLEAAVAGEAEYLVTGDADLLALGEYQGVNIVSPLQFAVVLGQLAGEDEAAFGPP